MCQPNNLTMKLRSLVESEVSIHSFNWTTQENVLESLSYVYQSLVITLLEKGCHHHTNDGSALCQAVADLSWQSTFEQLLILGVYVNDRNCRGDTALHLAFMVDEDCQAVGLLMDSYFSITCENLKNCHGLSFLHIACAKSTFQIVQMMLGKFLRDIDCQVSPSVEWSYAGCTPLHFAVRHNQCEIAALLLKHDADIYAQDRSGSTPLHLALERGDINMIDLILHNDHLHDNCVNNSGLTHFMAACAGSAMTVVREFLMAAETAGRISPTNLINDRVKDCQHLYAGYTPLHFAVRAGNLQTVTLLLERGASCFALTVNHLTPLDIARDMGLDEICQLLKSFGEDRKEALLISWMEGMVV